MNNEFWESDNRIAETGQKARNQGKVLKRKNCPPDKPQYGYWKHLNPNEIQAEVSASKIINGLKSQGISISAAQTEQMSWDGCDGIISLDTKTTPPVNPFIRFVPANSVLTRQSIETIRRDCPQLEKPVVNMLFVDCLTANTDRHGSNWEIAINKRKDSIITIAPLFDHESSQKDNLPDKLQTCKIYWSDNQETYFSQLEMFAVLCNEYSEQIEDLLKKSRNLDCHTIFTSKQLAKMQTVYEKAKNPVPSNSDAEIYKNRYEENSVEEITGYHRLDPDAISLPEFN